MANDQAVEHGTNTAVAIMYTAIFLGVMLLAIALVFQAIGSTEISQNGYVHNSAHVNNETQTLVTAGNATSVSSNLNCLLISATMTNSSGGEIVPASNYTLNSPSNCYIKSAATGLYKNTLVNVTYVYQYDTTNTTTVIGLGDIQSNVVGMVINFFALMPTVGTILAVVILIAGIVILVLYVRRMKDSGQEHSGEFQG